MYCIFFLPFMCLFKNISTFKLEHLTIIDYQVIHCNQFSYNTNEGKLFFFYYNLTLFFFFYNLKPELY